MSAGEMAQETAPVAEPGGGAEPGTGPVTMPPLALVEVLDRDGRARQTLRVESWPLRLGRAIDNDIVIDDPHVAPHHAVIEALPDGTARLRVLPGMNGMRCGRRTLPAGGEPVALDALAPAPPAAAAGASVGAARGAIELVAGHTRLRLRRAGDALEPERALPAARAGYALTLALALLLWLWVLAEQALTLDPGSKASDWIAPLLAAPLVLAGWCVVWGLASKIFQHRFEFWPHLAVAVRALLAVEVVTFVLLWLSALSGWPAFSRVLPGVTAGIGVWALWAQARLVLPQQRRALAWAAAAAFVAGTTILLALNQQRHERWFAELYSYLLPPPALMWQTPTAREVFVKRTERLRPALDKSAAEAAAENKDRGDDSDEE